MLSLCIINSVGRIQVINSLHSEETVVSISRRPSLLAATTALNNLAKSNFGILLTALSCFITSKVGSTNHQLSIKPVSRRLVDVSQTERFPWYS